MERRSEAPAAPYRLWFGGGAYFYGRYPEVEVTPPSRIVWTNEEGGAADDERVAAGVDAPAGLTVHERVPGAEPTPRRPFGSRRQPPGLAEGRPR